MFVMPVVFSCAIKYFYSAAYVMHFRSPELPGTVVKLQKDACAGLVAQCKLQAQQFMPQHVIPPPPSSLIFFLVLAALRLCYVSCGVIYTTFHFVSNVISLWYRVALSSPQW